MCVPSGFVNWQLSKVGSYTPIEGGRQEPYLQVNSFGSLEFPEAGTLGVGGSVILGMWPSAVRRYVTVLFKDEAQSRRGFRGPWLEIGQEENLCQPPNVNQIQIIQLIIQE